MNLRLRLVVAASTFLPVLACGQAVDPSVGTVDPSVNARVQDSDHSITLLPGASGPWTGELSLNPAPASAKPVQAGASTASQFPSLTGMSSWGGTPFTSSNTQTASTPPQSSNTGQDRTSVLLASQWSKLTGTKLTDPRKLAMILSAVEVSPKKFDATDEFSAERNESTDPKAQLRTLKRAAQRTARVKITNPFQNKADAANAGRWRGTVFTAHSLEQERHQEALRMLQGYTDQTERKQRRHRHRGAVRPQDYR
jgi:hypothetical protein